MLAYNDLKTYKYYLKMNYNTSDYINLVLHHFILQLWKIHFVFQNFRDSDSDSDSTWKILIDSDSAQNLAIPPIPESIPIPIPHHCFQAIIHTCTFTNRGVLTK